MQTNELDGERNLKPLLAPKYTHQNFEALFTKNVGASTVHCEFIAPDKDLYNYSGRILIDNVQTKENVRIDIDIRQFLHRSAVLKNSDQVMALVV